MRLLLTCFHAVILCLLKAKIFFFYKIMCLLNPQNDFLIDFLRRAEKILKICFIFLPAWVTQLKNLTKLVKIFTSYGFFFFFFTALFFVEQNSWEINLLYLLYLISKSNLKNDSVSCVGRVLSTDLKKNI